MTAGQLDASPLDGAVLVIGTGLIGTSVALSLRRAGVEVLLSDIDPDSVRTAQKEGAGRPLEDADDPAVVVVAVPPRHAASVLADASARFPRATLTDVTSVKERVIGEAIELGADPARLVGGHPMAGREVSGAAGARVDLLDDRLWVVTPTPDSGSEHVHRVLWMASACGAHPVEMGLAEHDAAVALVSHTPQVLASVLAGRLVGSDLEQVRIAGQGLRDMTRIAASNVPMWSDILAANAGPVADVLDGVIADLTSTVDALRAEAVEGSAAEARVRRVLEAGVEGQHLIPGKHGAEPSTYREVTVFVADKPGELARLFAVVGEASVNLEDIRIEHVFGHPSGLVALFVRPDAGDQLIQALGEHEFDVRY